MPGHARAAVKAMAYRARLRHAQGLPDADAYLLAALLTEIDRPQLAWPSPLPLLRL